MEVASGDSPTRAFVVGLHGCEPGTLRPELSPAEFGQSPVIDEIVVKCRSDGQNCGPLHDPSGRVTKESFRSPIS
jgi:hypothetical protein